MFLDAGLLLVLVIEYFDTGVLVPVLTTLLIPTGKLLWTAAHMMVLLQCFAVLSKNTSTYGRGEPGIEPPILGFMDN